MTLEWRKIHPDAVGSHTKCRRYSVCRTTDDGSRWEVWKLVPGGAWFFQLASGLDSEQAAQEVAQQDANGTLERKRA